MHCVVDLLDQQIHAFQHNVDLIKPVDDGLLCHLRHCRDVLKTLLIISYHVGKE